MIRQRPRVAMALFGDLTYDSRVRKEAFSLAEAGYDVTIVCLASKGARADLPDSVKVLVRLPSGASVIPGTSNPFVGEGAQRSRGILGRVSWLVRYVRGLRAWGRLAVEAAGPVDVWHAHDLTGLAALAPSLPQTVPLVYDSHELFLESGTAATLPGPARRVLRMYEGRLVLRASAVITVNDEIGAELRHRYRPRSISIVHNCPILGAPVPDGGFLRSAARVAPDVPIVLYHGGLVSGRGIESLMAALLDEGLQDVHLVLMGHGHRADELRALARTTAWQARLHVLEPVEPSVLLPWVAGADAGAMVNPGATLNDVYSSPNKLFECMAAGVPVVASDFPTMRRIVMDNSGGPLGAVCDPGDVAGIARSIESIVRLQPGEKETLRGRCRRAARDRWNWEREVRALLDVYEAVLPASSHARRS